MASGQKTCDALDVDWDEQGLTWIQWVILFDGMGLGGRTLM